MGRVRRARSRLALVGAMLLLFAPAGPVLGHGPVTVTVTPSQVTAGDPVTLGVAGVEPDQQRVIILVGQGIVVPFPVVRTDEAGAFTATVTIPSRLPGGTYRFEAIGDETLTGDLDVLAAAGGIAAEAPTDLSVPSSRTRSSPETGAILALALAAAALGLVLVLRAERVGHSLRP